MKSRLPRRYTSDRDEIIHTSTPPRRYVTSAKTRRSSVLDIPKRGSLVNPPRSRNTEYTPSYDVHGTRSRTREPITDRRPRSRTPVSDRSPLRPGRWVSPHDRTPIQEIFPRKRGRNISASSSGSSSDGISERIIRPRIVRGESPTSRTPNDEFPRYRPSMYQSAGPSQLPGSPRVVQRSPRHYYDNHMDIEEIQPRRSSDVYHTISRRNFSSSEDEALLAQERSPLLRGRSFITRSPRRSSSEPPLEVVTRGRRGLSETTARVLRRAQPTTSKPRVRFDLPD